MAETCNGPWRSLWNIETAADCMVRCSELLLFSRVNDRHSSQRCCGVNCDWSARYLCHHWRHDDVIKTAHSSFHPVLSAADGNWENVDPISVSVIYWTIVKQVAQLWQRDRASSIDDFNGWVNLRLNFRLKGYVSRHYYTLRLLTQCLVLRPSVFRRSKYRMLQHQETRSRHSKCANSIPLT